MSFQVSTDLNETPTRLSIPIFFRQEVIRGATSYSLVQADSLPFNVSVLLHSLANLPARLYGPLPEDGQTWPMQNYVPLT